MFSNPTAITFVGYLLVIVCVGFYAYYHTRSYGDYILGGRSLGGFVTALSVGASDMSGWLLMGLPGAVYLAGISQSWVGHHRRRRDPALLHDLLRLGRGRGRPPLREHLQHVL